MSHSSYQEKYWSKWIVNVYKIGYIWEAPTTMISKNPANLIWVFFSKISKNACNFLKIFNLKKEKKLWEEMFT